MERAYAELFIRSDLDREMVACALAAKLNGTRTGVVVAAGAFELEVRENPYVYDPATDAPDSEFLGYPLMAEVEAFRPGTVDDDFVAGVRATMLALSAIGASVVVACDFEDLLPGGGRLGA